MPFFVRGCGGEHESSKPRRIVFFPHDGRRITAATSGGNQPGLEFWPAGPRVLQAAWASEIGGIRGRRCYSSRKIRRVVLGHNAASFAGRGSPTRTPLYNTHGVGTYKCESSIWNLALRELANHSTLRTLDSFGCVPLISTSKLR